MNPPIFETYTDETLARVRETYAQRGTEYGDSWNTCQWLTVKAVAKKLGVHIPEEFIRAVAVASLVDVKYNRLEGGYKDDTIIDSIAYKGLLAEEMRRQEIPKDLVIKDTDPRQPGLYGGGILPATTPIQATAHTGIGSSGRSHL